MTTAPARAEAGARGTDVRSDCWVAVAAAGDPPSLDVKSKVDAFYGASIRDLARATLATLGSSDLSLWMEDGGALPYVIMARLEAAVRRLRPETAACALPPWSASGHSASERRRLRRSRLYLPGTTPKFYINAGLHKPDAVILDLEDSVPPGEKDTARLLVRNALRAVDFYGAEKMVRINPLPLGLEDVRALAPHGVHTFLLAKTESPGDVVAIEHELDNRQRAGLLAHDIYLIPIIESARGLLQAGAIAAAADSVVGLSIGIEDYTTDIGVQRSADGHETLFALSQIVNAARAAGVQPLASVYSDVGDMTGLAAWARQARALGFDGVGCLHPRQIAVVHEAFAPGQAELERARRIVAAFAEAAAVGQGVATVDGKMVDLPIVERARRVLQLAAASSKRAGDE